MRVIVCDHKEFSVHSKVDVLVGCVAELHIEAVM